MKKLSLFVIITLLIIACNTSEKPPITTKDKVVKQNKPANLVELEDLPKPKPKPKKKRDWQENFGLTHNLDKDTIWHKPARFYIKHPDCNPRAKAFYYGKYRPVDHHTTTSLLALVTTDNDDLRPFYRWILYKTFEIADGGLAEYTGQPARKYVEKFPKEFFEYADSDKTNDIYLSWYNSILYSGYYETDDYKKPKEIRARMINEMVSHCIDCEFSMIERIEQLALDCFSDKWK